MKRSITDFMAALSGGGVRPNQYEIVLIFPEGTAEDTNDTSRLCRMLAKSATVPGASAGTVMAGLPGGGVIKVPGTRSFDNWTTNILCDSRMRLRDSFERWSKLIFDYEEQLTTRDVGDAMTTIEVRQLDRDSSVLRTYTLHYAWPVSIESMNLGYDMENSVHEFGVTFAYHYHTWTPAPTDTDND